MPYHPIAINTPAHARHHSSLLERRQHMLPWQLHVIPVYKPSSTLLHLTATKQVAHDQLSIKKEGILKAKSPSWMFVIAYISVSPERALTGNHTSQSACTEGFVCTEPEQRLLAPKGTWGRYGERISGSTQSRTQVPHFQSNTLPNGSLSIFKSTDPNT